MSIFEEYGAFNNSSSCDKHPMKTQSSVFLVYETSPGRQQKPMRLHGCTVRSESAGYIRYIFSG